MLLKIFNISSIFMSGLLTSLTSLIPLFSIGDGKFKCKYVLKKKFDSRDIDLINCSTFNGTIEIDGNDGKEIDFEATILSRKELNDEIVNKYIRFKEEGFELDIQTETHIWDRIKIGSVDYKLVIPSILSVNATTSNGDVKIKKIEGGVILKTANGDIDVKEAKGEVMVRTANGDVKIDECAIAKVRTANGDIELKSVEQFMLDTSNGNISVDSNTVCDFSNATTARGDIKLKLNPFARAVLSTRMGNISIKGFDREDSDNKTIIGGESTHLASTGKYNLDVSTALGDIDISKK